MRLIDADLLLERMKGTDRYFAVKFDVEQAPTVTDVIDKEAFLAEIEAYKPDVKTGAPEWEEGYSLPMLGHIVRMMQGKGEGRQK